MNRMKIFLISIASILLLIILGSAVRAADDFEWGKEGQTMSFEWDNVSSDYIDYTGSDGDDMTFSLLSGIQMHNMLTNVYCVEAHQNIGTAKYRVTATAEITGNYVHLTQYKYLGEKAYSVVKEEVVTTEGDISNILAGCLYSTDLNAKWGLHPNYAEEKQVYVKGKQIAVSVLWNDWVEALPDYWKNNNIFTTSSANPTYYQNVKYHSEPCLDRLNDKIDEFTNKGQIYSIKIYFCQTADGNDYQDLIVPEKIDPQTISIPVQKVWNDGNNVDGTRPSSITVKLLADGADTGKKLTLKASTTESSNWKGTFTGLKIYNGNGEKIVYTIEEVSVSGYTASISGDSTNGFKITNNYSPEKVKLKVQKVWDDDNNRDGMQPKEIKVNLVAGEDVIEGDISLNASNNWTYTTGELSKYSNGAEIDYTFKEVNIPDGYSVKVVAGAEDANKVITYTITNKHVPDKIDIPVEKIWSDDNNRDGTRPTSITVKLYADGVDTGKTLTLNESVSWKGSFTGLSKYKDKQLIEYTIGEVSVDNYTTSISGDSTSGFVINNTLIPENIKLKVQKVWEDDNNRDGKRTEIKVRLKKGSTIVQDNIVLNEANGWTYTTGELYKNENGNPIDYTFEEVNIPGGYDVTIVKGKEDVNKIVTYTITNKYEPELVEIPVEKTWDDDSNRDGKRPETIQVELYADGKLVTTATIEGNNSGNTWNYTFKSTDDVKLYKYSSGGNLIKYTVKEVKVGNVSTDSNDRIYTPTINGLKIINKYTPEKISVKVLKEWDDDENRDGMRPQSITLILKANGELAKDVNGRNVSTIKLTKENNWQCEVGNLFKYYDHGKEIKYTLEEQNISSEYEYSFETEKNNDGSISATLKAINKHYPELVEIPIEKTWDDDSDRDGLRPDSIQLNLWADKGTNYEKLVQTAVIVGSQNDNIWSYTFTSTNETQDDQKIYKYRHEGILINYTIEEIAIKNSQPYNAEQKYEQPKYTTGNDKTITANAGTITGTKTIRDTSTDGFGVINKYEPERAKIKVIKQWNDEKDLDEYRPESITLKLLANGEPAKDADGKDVSTIVLKEPDGKFSDTWEVEVTNLFRYYNHGKEIEYTIVEEKVPDHYTAGSVQIETNLDENKMKVVTLKIENKHEPNYDGYIEITGKVWEDILGGKANVINGNMEDDESGIGGIKVTLKDANGNQFDATSTTTTDEKGNYTIKVNYDNSKNVYKLYQDVAQVREKLNTAYVEFEYDGMKYTTVKTTTTGTNTSKAIENESIRNNFDNAHNTVNSSTKHPDSWTDKIVTAMTKGVISFETYSDKQNRTSTEVLKYCNGNGTYIRTNPEGAWNDILTGKKALSNHRDHTDGCSGNGHTMRTYEVPVEVIQNVNLGLFKREQPNVAIFSDLSKVEVEMQGQKYTYIYNVRSNEKNNVGLQVKFQNKGTYEYKRPVNPADIAYIQEEANKDAMSVKVTYEVKVANLSTTVATTVSKITNYYDSRYTLINPGWDISAGSQFNKATNTGDLNIRLAPKSESSAIELTYTVSVEAIRDLLNENATLNNAVEIGAYSTFYGNDTLYAEQRTGGRTNQPYAGYDYNSHPGNVTTPTNRIRINSEARLEIDNQEDDEDIAPSFVLCKDDENKLISGNIWEDTDTGTETGPDNFRVGDGKKSGSEQNLANVKVELYKVKDDGTTELAKLYNSNDGTTIPAVTYSDNNGNYSFGNDEYSILTDKYLIKFTYGEGIDGSRISTIKGQNVNARNYKSTIISSETELYNIYKGTSSDEEWHLNIPAGYSIAVDDIEKRVGLTDLQYNNFGDQIYMEAYSKPFKLQVEFNPESKESSVGTNGKTTFGNNLSVFDFGIIERAREDIFVEKTIENVNVTLANGQVLTQGNPREGRLNYVKANGFTQVIDSGITARNALQKQMIIEIDAELIQGAQLDIKYAITVTNNSEKEYDYYIGDATAGFDSSKLKTEFYYFGTNNENSPIITSSVNLVDYVDTDLAFEWENETEWDKISMNDLNTKGLISPQTREALASNKYQAYITDKYNNLLPGTSSTDFASASRLLANTEENVFENHIEILKISAKSARIKDYRMGNYVPSLDEPDHEQDDHYVSTIITPPTGLTNYVTIYVIAGLFGLIVLSVGILIIKKKIL